MTAGLGAGVSSYTLAAARSPLGPVNSAAASAQATPHAVTRIHTRWVDAVNTDASARRSVPPPSDPPVRSEPMIAIPRTLPTWRDVDTVADATPACSGGMPVTALLVIGGLTRPNPS